MSGTREALTELDALLDFGTPWSCDCIADKSAIHAAFEKARAALATPDWLPIPRDIDTTRAPFDGEPVLVAVGDEQTVARYCDGKWQLTVGDVTEEYAELYGEPPNPTWYQPLGPLPAPPTENDDAH